MTSRQPGSQVTNPPKESKRRIVTTKRTLVEIYRNIVMTNIALQFSLYQANGSLWNNSYLQNLEFLWFCFINGIELFFFLYIILKKGNKDLFFGDFIFPTWLVVEFNVGWFFSLTQSDDDAAVTDSRPRAWNLDEAVESELAVWIVRPAAASRSSGSMDPSEQASTPPNTPGFDPPQPVGSVVGNEDEFWARI